MPFIVWPIVGGAIGGFWLRGKFEDTAEGVVSAGQVVVFGGLGLVGLKLFLDSRK